MDKRVGHGPRLIEKLSTERGVVDLADARVRIRSRVKPTTESLMGELDEIRSLLDQGLSTEAKDRLALLISTARYNPQVLALARIALSTALEQQGHYRDAEVDFARLLGQWRCKPGPYLRGFISYLPEHQ